jgi:hypothetical protein
MEYHYSFFISSKAMYVKEYFPMYITSLFENYIFSLFAHLVIRQVVFLFFNFLSSLYILDINPLSGE